MGTLYLIPTPLGKHPDNHVLPEHTIQIVRELKQFVVENIRSAQSFLQWIGHPLKPYEPEFRILNRKTPEQEVYSFVQLLQSGDVGLMSEAGAPAIADPGKHLVRFAHHAGYRVAPLTGPSSITLALMASGMNGQQFAFHGYLPVDEKKRENKILQLEKESRHTLGTQIFIETPYRNDSLLNSLINICRPETTVAVATNLTLPDEQIVRRKIYKWKEESRSSLNSHPAVFLLSAE